MSDASGGPILAINTGSSSLKFGMYVERAGKQEALLDGSAEGIGGDRGKLDLRDIRGNSLRSEERSFSSQSDALDQAVEWLGEFSSQRPSAIGHRVVHGGPHLLEHQRITPAVVEQLRAALHFAPLHIPLALQLIEKTQQIFPELPQFACFDTAFHATIPEVSARFALPRGLFDEGIHRYGFHGLSYESVLYQLGHGLASRVVVAHLGSGASLAAIRDGKSVGTTMGLTPTGGIPMATRSGDLDPGILLYLLRAKRMDVDSLEKLLNRESGLTGLAGGTGDMRDLEAAANSGSHEAQMAIDVFTGSIREQVAAYAALLGGLDLLVFTGGIGEHSATIRSAVCNGLRFLGFDLDEESNWSHQQIISTNRSKVRVRIVSSQENRQIARHCRRLMRAG